jgi:hypothetical protein
MGLAKPEASVPNPCHVTEKRVQGALRATRWQNACTCRFCGAAPDTTSNAMRCTLRNRHKGHS